MVCKAFGVRVLGLGGVMGFWVSGFKGFWGLGFLGLRCFCVFGASWEELSRTSKKPCDPSMCRITPTKPRRILNPKHKTLGPKP